jgi:outer membrane receptor protein involved in Fe transport
VRLRASAYTGFRAGTSAELFVDNRGRGVTAANPTLSPEELLGVEVGVDLTSGRSASTRFTGYWSEATNLIERILIGRAGPEGDFIEPCGVVQPNGQCLERQNLGEVRIYGLEIEHAMRFDRYWNLHFSGALLDTEVTSSPGNPEIVGNRTVRTPNQTATLSLGYANPKIIQAEVQAQWIGDRFDDAENEDRLEELLVVDLSAARNLSARWRILAGVVNVFDEDEITDISSGLPQRRSPRTYHLGFSFRSR